MEADRYFEEVFLQYSDMVYKISVHKTKNFEEAKDIVQEVFIKLYKELKKGKIFNDSEHCKALLIRITINLCNNKFRSFWQKSIFLTDKQIGKKSEQNNDLLDEIKKLPVKYQEVIYLYYYENYKIEEISIILKRNKNTILSQLSRARENLKLILEEL